MAQISDSVVGPYVNATWTPINLNLYMKDGKEESQLDATITVCC